jgi:hypothetical protein
MAAVAAAARWVGIGRFIVQLLATGSYSALWVVPVAPRTYSLVAVAAALQ